MLVAAASAVADDIDPSARSRPGFGTIEGALTYKADPARRWRYARYYVDRKTGRLAEAVIALQGKSDTPRTDNVEPKTIEVDQKNFMFTPETVAIRAGDRVRFLNNDGAVHNVAATHLRHSFNVNLQPGRTHEETFPHSRKIDQPYRLGCIFHSAMRAWIYVFDHPLFDTTEKDGQFRLINVPPGEYTLDVVHPAGELRTSQTVTVKADATVKVETELSPDDKVSKKTTAKR